jgi:hypothetical protein
MLPLIGERERRAHYGKRVNARRASVAGLARHEGRIVGVAAQAVDQNSA